MLLLWKTLHFLQRHFQQYFQHVDSLIVLREELLKNQHAESIVENASEENEASFTKEAIENYEGEADNSADLREFGVDTEEPDLFNVEHQTPNAEDLLGSNDDHHEEDDLEIPAFLRRQKN